MMPNDADAEPTDDMPSEGGESPIAMLAGCKSPEECVAKIESMGAAEASQLAMVIAKVVPALKARIKTLMSEQSSEANPSNESLRERFLAKRAAGGAEEGA